VAGPSELLESETEAPASIFDPMGVLLGGSEAQAGGGQVMP
jgi:hypothetical protein